MKKVIKAVFLFTLIVALIFCVAGIVSTDTIEIKPGFEGSYIEVSKEKIRYQQIGEGPDLLFIHGVPGSLEDWQPVINQLSSRFRVTAYDRPGQGFSSANNSGHTVEYNARIALDLIDALRLKDVIVIGHSYGGSVIMGMAVKNPPQVKAFITIAGASYPLEYVDPLFHLIRIPIFGRGLAVISSSILGPGMIKDGVEQAFYPNLSEINGNYTSQRIPIWMQSKTIVGMAKEELNLTEDLNKIAPLYRHISKPFYIVHGEDDQLVPSNDSKQLREVIEHSELTVLKNTGHQVQFVRPDEVIAIIRKVADKH
ncbi:alpha/beta hydrolase [bacterium]|nr:alpha/beta hydrolase [bacterium]